MKYLQEKIAKKLFFCMVLIIFVLISVSVTHAETYNYNEKLGSPGTAAKQFHHPFGVAVDSDGNVYVADTDNNRIQKFDSDGVYIVTWGLPGTKENEFNKPSGVVVDSDGNVYVADTGNNRIQKFNSDGGYIFTWGLPGTKENEFNKPSGVVVDSDGNVYVADTGNNRIQKFDRNGDFITFVGNEKSATSGIGGSGPGEFYYPRGVAVDSDDNVYVADTDNNRIQKFNSDGGYIFTWGLPGTKENEFNKPSGVAVDSDGNVYVADTGNNRIQKFSLFADTTTSITSSSNLSKSGQSVTFTAEVSTTSKGAGEPSGTVTFFDGNTQLGDRSLSTGQATLTISSLSVGSHSITAKYNGATNFNTSTSNILTQNVSDLEVPVAEFSYYPTGLTVQFNDTSSGNINSWSWNFGDGAKSIEPNPKHNYSSAGNYTVTLKVKNEDGKDATQTKEISVSPLPINVMVSSEPESVETNKSSTITVNVTGATGEVISGASVELTTTDIGNFDRPSGMTDSSGQFISNFTSSKKGTARITAHVTKEGFNKNSSETTIIVTDPELENLSVSMFSEPESIKPGESSKTIVTVKGANGEGISGASVELITDTGNFDRPSGTTDSGQFISIYTASAEGNNTITAYVTKEGFNGNSSKIEIVVQPLPPEPKSINTLNVSVSSESKSVKTDESSKITVTVTGSDGEVISGAYVILGTDIGNFDQPSGPTNSFGIFTSNFTSSKAGTATITANVTKEGFSDASDETSVKVKGSIIILMVAILSVAIIGVVIYTKKPKPAPPILPVETALYVKIEPESIPTGKSKAQVTVRLKDENGHFVEARNERIVELSTTLGTVNSPIKISPGDTTVSTTITSGEVAGDARVTASSSPLKEATAKVSFVSK